MDCHPDNVALNKGEAGLDRPSVAIVAALFTLDRALLGSYLGTLSCCRLGAILLSIRLLLDDDEVVDRLL